MNRPCTASANRPGPRPRPRAERSGDGGFVLLESIVTISLITIIMTALASFFLSAQESTNQQRSRQTATQVAASTVETLRGLPASDLVFGRGSGAVTTQFTGAPAAVKLWLTGMDPAIDAEPAPDPAVPKVPSVPVTTVIQTVNNVAYGVTSYLGWCVVAGASPNCVTGTVAGATTYLRAVVAITWRNKRCPASACTYLTATLVSADDDPVFELNQAPPSFPVAVDPPDQKSVIPEPVSLQLTLVPNTGVPPYTWQITAGSLPAGLTMTPAGLISGIPDTPVANRPFSATVTDAFLRQSEPVAVLWTVFPPLTITPPGDRTSVRDTPITALALTATGGLGAPYTWSLEAGSTLPPGLALAASSGQITGTPTVAGDYRVRVVVKDSSNVRTASAGFTWKISYPPFSAGAVSTQVDSVNRPIPGLQLSTTGGSGSSVWSGGGTLPAGLSLSPGGLITGTPTAVGNSAVQLVVTDSTAVQTRTVSFQWSVVSVPTVTAPGDQFTRTGVTVSLALATTCPNSPCTYRVNAGPPGLSVSGSGIVSGTITGGTQTFPAVTVTVTDRDGATSTSGPFRWVVGTYATTVGGTAGLLSYWRLGEPATSLIASDSFTGTAGSNLLGRTAELGGTWATVPANSQSEKISTEGRVYRSLAGYSVNYRSTAPVAVSYSVEADLVPKSILTGDQIGVIGRLITADNSTYLANWEQANASWNITRVVKGVVQDLGAVTGQPAMVVGRSTRLRLELSGNGTTTTLTLYVNGVRTVGPVTDSTAVLQTVGRAGFLDGNIASTTLAAKTDQTGIHLDNFQVTPGAATALLSRGKTVTATSVEQDAFPASAAVDGNTGTRWSSAFSDPQSIQIDLGTTATVRQVVLNWENAYGRAFQLEVSATGTGGWISIYQTTTGAGGIQTLNVNGSGRYVRLTGTQRATTYGYSLFEFEVYGDTGSAYPRAIDRSGSNTGDYENGVVLGVTGALAADTDTAAQLDGTNEYVQATGTAGLPVGASARSVELWFKTTGTTRQTLFDYGSLATDAKFALFLEAGGGSLYAWGYGSNDRTFTLPRPVNDGAWHHVVKTYNGTSITLYVDGVQVGAPVTATRATALDAYGFSIGAVLSPDGSNGGKFFRGAIDEVAVYTVALTPADVAAHYELGSP